MAEKKWEGTTYGNGLMHRWLIGLLKFVDIRVIYVLAYIFAVTPTLFKPGFGHTYRFFKERLGYSAVRSRWLAYKNYCQFAQAVVDKFAMYAGHHFDIELEGYDHFLALAAKPEGFVQLSSHIGNYEIAGYSLVAETKRFNALVYSGEKEEVMSNRKKLFEHANINMIPIQSDMSHLFEINAALANGETVSIPADRIWGAHKFVSKMFLGKEAHLPVGPFQVVTSRGLEALVVHVIKLSTKRYKIYVSPLSYDKNAPRSKQIEELSENYVKELERIVRLYPTQWHNYFDFWNQK
jgi:predicted LPLAT superfamily acyltransferase